VYIQQARFKLKSLKFQIVQIGLWTFKTRSLR